MPKRTRLSKGCSVARKLRMKGLGNFLNIANLEINTTDGKVMGVGLPWGESKKLASLGITRKDQIKYLDYLQDNPELLRKVGRL